MIYKQAAEFLFAILFLGLGILACQYTFDVTKIGLEGTSWIPVSTSITYTYIEQTYGSRTGSSGIEYIPQPTYTFVARDGKTYSGKQYSIPATTLRYPAVTKEMLNNPVVVESQIFYNPNNPNESAVQQPIFDPMLDTLFGALGLFGLFGGLALTKDIPKKYKAHNTLNFH